MTQSDKSLRASIIRLAAQHPEFRKDLLPIIKQAGFPADSIGKPVSGPKGIADSDAKKPWAKDEFTQQENEELQDKQEDGALSDGKADKVAKIKAAVKSASTAVEASKIAFRTARTLGESQEVAAAIARRVRDGWKA